MGNATAGIQPVGVYAGVETAGAALYELLSLIPNPDAPHGSGAMANPNSGAGHLDEMSPGAAAQLRAELAAIIAVVNLWEPPA